MKAAFGDESAPLPLSPMTSDTWENKMADNQIVDSLYTSAIEAPIQQINIPDWCFSLNEAEYKACSPAHITAGLTTAPDGRRMAINVEIIGGSLMVQHWVESVSKKDHLVLNSVSDIFTSSGRTIVRLTWELSVTERDKGRCEFSNRVRSYATDEMLTFLARQGIPFDQFRALSQPAAIAHNQAETPLFAASIERFALRNE